MKAGAIGRRRCTEFLRANIIDALLTLNDAQFHGIIYLALYLYATTICNYAGIGIVWKIWEQGFFQSALDD